MNPEVQSHKYVFQLWLKYLKLALFEYLCAVFKLLQCICAYLLNLIGRYFDVLEFKPLDMLLQSSTSHLTGSN